MMNTLLRVALALFLLHAPAAAQSDAMLVDVNWLAAHLNDPDLVLLHVGDRAEYDAEHIPGARFVRLADIARPHDRNNPADLALELPAAEELRASLARFGISDNSRIVVYFSKDWVTPATRVIFTLDYIGLGERTSLLNGGMPAWKKAGHAVTKDVPVVTPGRLTARPTKALVVDAGFVNSLPQRTGHRLVDARAAVYFNGTEPTYQKPGHIPGAINIPFTEITDENLLITRDALTQRFLSAGIQPGETIVAYCHIGQQATAVVFAASLLGHPVVLYDGAFQDWATNNRGPVTR
jgi:thiosulfate/3-mercaptopyruvate sulfurtransferase